MVGSHKKVKYLHTEILFLKYTIMQDNSQVFKVHVVSLWNRRFLFHAKINILTY